MEKDDFITSVCVTNCGNFGVLGYNSGKIIKFNMQSGIIKYKVTPINRQSSVNGIEIDCVNRNMCCINGDGSFNCYDFYNGPYHCLFT